MMMMMMNFNFKTICKFAVVSLTVLESPLGSVNATDMMDIETDAPPAVAAAAAVTPGLIAPESFAFETRNVRTPPLQTRMIRCPGAPLRKSVFLFVVIVIVVVVVFFSNFV